MRCLHWVQWGCGMAAAGSKIRRCIQCVCVVITILLLNVLLFRDACILVACACGLTSCVRYIIQWLQSGFRHYNCITCTFNMVCSNQGCA